MSIRSLIADISASVQMILSVSEVAAVARHDTDIEPPVLSAVIRGPPAHTLLMHSPFRSRPPNVPHLEPLNAGAPIRSAHAFLTLLQCQSLSIHFSSWCLVFSCRIDRRFFESTPDVSV